MPIRLTLKVVPFAPDKSQRLVAAQCDISESRFSRGSDGTVPAGTVYIAAADMVNTAPADTVGMARALEAAS